MLWCRICAWCYIILRGLILSNKIKIGKKKKAKSKKPNLPDGSNNILYDKSRIKQNKDIKVSNSIYRGKSG